MIRISSIFRPWEQRQKYVEVEEEEEAEGEYEGEEEEQNQREGDAHPREAQAGDEKPPGSWEEDRTPAALHKQYSPSEEQRRNSDVPYHGEAAVDVVFVHGLGSKFDRTWAYRRKDGTYYHWLKQQFPKDMPDARVLVYEYASEWYGNPVHTSLEECARQFLQTLVLDRRHARTGKLCPTRRTRPIILVGHSFGGLVIKAAMNMAREVKEKASSTTDSYQSSRDILTAIAGVIFLGTPHRGSSFGWLAGLKSWFGRSVLSVETDDGLITILTPSSHVLEALQDDFEDTLSDEWLIPGPKLVCYYEMRNVSPLRRVVVEQESAVLGKAAATRGMDANHMEMNKFCAGDEDGRRKDSNYDHFLSDVQMMFLEAQGMVPKRFNKWVYGSDEPDEARQFLQRALMASQREAQEQALSRYLKIYREAPYTCQWIHHLPGFVAWRSGGADMTSGAGAGAAADGDATTGVDGDSNTTSGNKSSAIWLNGHGGSGKSVLTSYIIHSLRAGAQEKKTREPEESDSLDVPVVDEWSPCTLNVGEPACNARRLSPTVLYFFCGVERSSETSVRMLGTLVHQLLLAWPENEAMFKVARKLVSAASTTLLDAESLVETLAKMAKLAGPVYIAIDNLEDMRHSKDDGPSQFVKCLAALQAQSAIRILISSQETPQLVHAIAEDLRVTQPIDVTRHTARDIQRFTEDRGDALFRHKPALSGKRDTIMASLHARAHGSFQWVNSAFQHLQYIEDAGDVEPELDEIRGDLLDSYDKTFARLAQQQGGSLRTRGRVVLCLKFIAASATPVTSADVKMAWLVHAVLEESRNKPKDKTTTKSMQKAAYEEAMKDLFDKEKYEERIAVAEDEIRTLLGSIVDIGSDGTLQFKHPSYLKALTRVSVEGETETADAEHSKRQASKIKFAIEQAHRDLSHVCMAVCRFTTFIHTNSFAEADATPPLVQYAWSFWAYHLDKSQSVFLTVEEAADRRRWQARGDGGGGGEVSEPAGAGRELETTFDAMVCGVVDDSLLYVEALMDFISRPLKAVPGHFSDREYVLALQRAQEALIQPAKDLCSLKRLQYDSASSRLEHQRKRTEELLNFNSTSSAAEGATGLGASMSNVSQSLSLLRNEAADRLSGTKSRVLGEKSTVRRLRIDEYLETHPALPRPKGAPRLMVEAARNLRVVALRFAVDPIYSALLATAGGSSFSPLHPLVYLAQLLEEGALYPYWDELPPGRDLLEPFICPESDPEYASAKFVLHCFEWRDPRVDETTPLSPGGGGGGGRSSRPRFVFGSARGAHIAIDLRPCPTPNMQIGLTRVSTENFEQVRRLHQVQMDQIVVAQSTYGLFQGVKPEQENFFRNSVVNPLAHLHMRYSLLVEDDSLEEDPVKVLNRHVPQEVHESPVREMIRVMPALLGAYFLHFFVALLEVFGQMARHALSSHYAKIELAIIELKQTAAFFLRLRETDETDEPQPEPEPEHVPGEPIMPPPPRMPRLRWRHVVVGALVFALRCRYFPKWGAYYWYHAWGQFSWAWDHPSAYVDMQKEFGFWAICWSVVWYMIYSFVGNFAIALTLQPQPQPHTPAQLELMVRQGQPVPQHVPGLPPAVLDASFVYSVFHCLCTVDRSLFAIASALATLLACGLIMFSDVETVASMLRFSLVFWFTTFFQLVMNGIQLGALANGGGWKTLLGTTALHMGLLIMLCRNVFLVCEVLYAMTKPARFVAVWTFRVLLRASVVTAQAIGVTLLFFLAWRAFSAVHGFLWDPYNVRQSLKTLLQASDGVHAALARGTTGGGRIAAKKYRRIGYYPLGDKVPPAEDNQTLAAASRAALGPPRAVPPLQANMTEVQTNFTSAAGALVDNIGEFVVGADVSRRLDEVILAAGDHFGKAVDDVGGHVGRLVDGVGVQMGQIVDGVGAQVGEGARQLRIQAREALVANGHYKTE